MDQKKRKYAKLEGRIWEMGYKRREIAELLSISYGTLLNKLQGKTPWLWWEVLALRNVLQWAGPLEELMSRSDGAEPPRGCSPA